MTNASVQKYRLLWITSDYTCSLCLSPLQALPRTESLGIPFLHFHHPNHQEKKSGVRGEGRSPLFIFCNLDLPQNRAHGVGPGNLDYTGNGDRQQKISRLAEVFCNRRCLSLRGFTGTTVKSSQIESNRVKSSQFQSKEIESNRVKSSQIESNE